MKRARLPPVVILIGTSSLLLTSGCATAFVRSKSTVEPQHAYPATALDGELLWRSGVKGEPLFATTTPNERINPLARLASGAGCIMDLPFSIVFDTVMLPVDLSRGRRNDPDGKQPDRAMR